MDWFQLDDQIKAWLIEDMPYGDATSDPLFSGTHKSSGRFLAKEEGCIAGLPVAKRVFEMLTPEIHFQQKVSDGDLVAEGTVLAEIDGPTRQILKGERLALNLMQRLSGVATITNAYTKELAKTGAVITDTRKTTPGIRALEKYAVRMGGGRNHRFNLSEAVMLKDNHIQAAGGIRQAVERLRVNLPHTVKIEVEVDNLVQYEEALEARADIILLDNMDVSSMGKAVAARRGNVLLEASGNITLERVSEVAATGVDIISCGALTHSVKSLDISLEIDPEVPGKGE